MGKEGELNENQKKYTPPLDVGKGVRYTEADHASYLKKTDGQTPQLLQFSALVDKLEGDGTLDKRDAKHTREAAEGVPGDNQQADLIRLHKMQVMLFKLRPDLADTINSIEVTPPMAGDMYPDQALDAILAKVNFLVSEGSGNPQVAEPQTTEHAPRLSASRALTDHVAKKLGIRLKDGQSSPAK